MSKVGRELNIDFFIPRLPDLEEVLPFLKRVESAKHYSNFGPLVCELESSLAEYFGVRQCQVATAVNATLALEGAVQTIDVGYRWISPSWTYVATNLALERSNANYELGDVGIDWRLCKFESYSAFMDVCPFGDSLSLERFPNNGTPILVDAAASFAALRNCGRQFSDRTNPVGIVVSFHPTKLLPGVEGAVFISNKPEWIENFRNWSRFGMTSSSRNSDTIGTNAKMSEYQAAVILASFQTYPRIFESWLKIQQTALEVSRNLNFDCQPSMEKGELSPYWIIRGENEQIQLTENRVSTFGFSTRRWWEYGCHRMNAFGHKNTSHFAHTDHIASTTIALPFHLFMGDKEFDYIENCLKSLY